MNPSQHDDADSLAEIRERARRRLEELEPYLAEAAQLRRVIAAAGGDGADDEPLEEGRAPQGANKRRILATVADHPGVTPAQVARMTGMKRTVVAATMGRLKRAGELEPHGDGARVPPARLEHVRALVVAA